ncbi:MAG: diacylglycerol kinase family protein [Bacteroidia bacterium]
MKKIAFIINPISGGIQKKNIPERILRHIDRTQFSPEIHFSEYDGHMPELTREVIRKGAEVVVAVGGDGTISQVAGVLAGTNTLLGLMPMGSGDGLARHLNIPRNPERAIQILNQGKTMNIDSGKAGDHFFINLAGIGFDAHVSWMFARAPRRGFWSYARITLNEFARFKTEEIELTIDGKLYRMEGFVFCIANGSQYGNNAFIAPEADLTDGKFSISILKPFSPLAMPGIGLRLFGKKLNLSKHVVTLEGSEIHIRREKNGILNLDGESKEIERDFYIRMNPKSIRVLVP